MEEIEKGREREKMNDRNWRFEMLLQKYIQRERESEREPKPTFEYIIQKSIYTYFG